MNDKKLYRVEKNIIPEWGKDQTEWVRYFLAPDIDTVTKTVHERYGKPKYYSMDREAVQYSIEECQFETLDTRIEDRE